MPDITMCPGGNCPLKENCYRFTAKASEYHQSYFAEAPYDHEAKNCEYYWFHADSWAKSETAKNKKKDEKS